MNNADAWLIRFHRLLPDAESHELADLFFESGIRHWARTPPPHPLAVLLMGMVEAIDVWNTHG